MKPTVIRLTTGDRGGRGVSAKIKLPTLSCLRCGHSWYPRHPEPPKRCAKCGSPYWDRPRR